MHNRFQTIVIGGGPAGLAAALKAAEGGAAILLVEREARLGGILKQCVHDGFGVIRFGEKLSGPEYAERFMEEVERTENITVKTLTFVLKIEKKDGVFTVKTTSAAGIERFEAASIILANGCRERTARQVAIHGTRPAGILTAGAAQHYVNLLGVLPTKRCIILGSGDIGLIMARRLTLEGAEVLGVYEAKSTPSGLTRNLVQCLHDFQIPLHLSKTVTRVFGQNRLEAAEIMSVDEKMRPIPGTEERIQCDAVILSVGLIPENELAETLNIQMDPATKGPVVDQNMMTSLDGVYCAGNALHVHDLVDYVSECAETAGAAAKNPAEQRSFASVTKKGMLYLVPQRIDIQAENKDVLFYFRSDKDYARATLRITVNGEPLLTKKYTNLKPPEMERLQVKIPALRAGDTVQFSLEGEEKND